MPSTPAKQNSSPDYEAILLAGWAGNKDPAHDLAHVKRVHENARAIAAKEGGDWDVLEPAIWLHDLVNHPKDHPERHLASRQSAGKAANILKEFGTRPEIIRQVEHAIAAHSFSAGITPETREAKILQDADRLDALGAIGIARTFAVGGALGRPFYDPADPLAENRDLDDSRFTLDHFAAKLFLLDTTLQTQSARDIAAQRLSFMQTFITQLRDEIGDKPKA